MPRRWVSQLSLFQTVLSLTWIIVEHERRAAVEQNRELTISDGGADIEIPFHDTPF